MLFLPAVRSASFTRTYTVPLMPSGIVQVRKPPSSAGYPYQQRLGGHGSPGDSGGGSYATIDSSTYLVAITSFIRAEYE